MQEKGGRAKGEWRWAAGLAAGVLVFVATAYTAREAVRKPTAKPLHAPLVPKEEAEAPAAAGSSRADAAQRDGDAKAGAKAPEAGKRAKTDAKEKDAAGGAHPAK